MTFLRTIPPEEATGKLRELFDEVLKADGPVAEFTRALGLRPEAAAAFWAFHKKLTSALESTMKPRNSALAGFVAGLRLRCSA